ncbi:hypothetical protein Val02_25920 [Virgisporangium aliadipatigenens]|uniref:DUF4166 domain-containing protein n=1 Tax=Virgisporangium aliadipatigenens TaxID=741659 RepID=A0A8J3YII5_9ACTN|nr:DUF4166 domain-containing protein [Virgisporangium aliadipatigenens]GIJ45706.1 hypothetical protein Val02_25920 [Virgisporangium aliadipatigenens]
MSVVRVSDSIFARALGADFDRLHPRLRRRFGFAAADGIACIGSGSMERIWRGRAFTLPFLHVGSARHILFPETGHDVPFTIENWAYRDRYGRDTMTFVRTFELARRRRRFDATMIYSPLRRGIVDYLGTHQHLAVDLNVSVDARGGLRIRSGAQRFLRTRWPEYLTGVADLREWYDDASERFRIQVAVTHPRFGPLFGYSGSFVTSYVDTGTTPVPACAKPVRENPRE